ncbi:MAG: hypothetical protein AAF433_22875 [Bacteroidota bacterium]
MEHDYDIRFNRQEPTPEDIRAHQDFDALLEQLAANPTPPQAKIRRLFSLWASVAAAVAIVLGAYFLLRPGSSSLSPTEYFAQRPFIDPPLAQTSIPPFVLSTQSEDYIDQALLQDDETRVLVSRMQLANDRSARPVQLHHRTLDEVSDFFLAGIPMDYDSSGNFLQLDATAIIDLYATAGGERIQLVDETSYGMEFGTTVTAATDGSLPLFFLYQLDTSSRRWEYLSEIPAEVQNEANSPLADLAIVQDRQRLAQDYARRINDLENGNFNRIAPPTPPLNSSEGRPTLQLDFLNELELAEGSNVGAEELAQLNVRGDWQITPELPLIPENAFSVVWEQVKLVKLSSDRYELTLINPQRQERLIIRPIWQNEERYISEQNRYLEHLSDYETAAADWLDNREAEMAALVQQRDAALTAADQAIADYLASLPEEEASRLRRRVVNFQMELNALGTFAIAQSFVPDTPKREVQVKDEAGQAINGQVLYLDDGQHNTLYRYYAEPELELPLDENSVLWTVDEAGQLKMAKGNGQSATIATRNLGPLPQNVADMRALLKEQE